MHQTLIRHFWIPSLAAMMFLIIFSEPCLAQNESTPWKRYRTDNDQFSVTLPTLPALTTHLSSRPDRPKQRQEREIGAYADGVAYAISVIENVESNTLESFVRESNKFRDSSWKLSSLLRLTVNQINGLQESYPPPGVEGVNQYFATPERLYRFRALGAAPDDPRIAQFFSSISFTENPEGIQLVDGPGVLWRLPDSSANADPELNKAFVGKEVTRRVSLASKPEPEYTEVARRNRITGTVVLKVIFARDGSVESIRIVSELPDGLTENAIAVAKRIKFVPAVKDGRFVSMWMQLEYNFNLY